MKTAELTGAHLDYWVGVADGVKLFSGSINEKVYADRGTANDYAYVYSPSTDWSQGGPIIDRERPGFMHHSYRVGHKTEYSVDAFLPGRRHESGPTMLIAAMRAYVASKFGDEVPDIESN